MSYQIARIKAVVCAEFDIPRQLFDSVRRNRRAAHPRMVAMAMCREFTRASYPKIGSSFFRDHTTVLNAVRRIPELSKCPEFAAKVAAIRWKVSGGMPLTALPALYDHHRAMAIMASEL